MSLYLLQNVQRDGIKHVVNDNSQHGAGRGGQVQNSGVGRRRASILNGGHGLQHGLGPLVEREEVAQSTPWIRTLWKHLLLRRLHHLIATVDTH